MNDVPEIFPGVTPDRVQGLPDLESSASTTEERQLASVDLSKLTFAELQKLAAEAEALVLEKRTVELQSLVDAFRSHLETNGFDLAEAMALLTRRAPRKAGGKKAQKIAPKYRDPETGATWTGRGREPLWIKGKKREKFAI